jgi:transaldolase
MNPLRQLAELGQSVWLDYIRRSLLTGGELERLIEEDGLSGMTSNPAIFEKAIAGSADYDGALAALRAEGLRDPKAAYERIAVEDVRMAADALREVHERTGGLDGYVSLEVSPHLARDTEGTVEEARRLWRELDRPNVMIKVPATSEGIPAIERLVGQGLNVNVTLLFSRTMYERAARAYRRGLERLSAAGGPVGRVAGVASFFVSRIDTAVDRLLEERIAKATDAGEKERLRGLLGKAAIANSKLAYQVSKAVFSGEGWRALEGKGARRQRLLWASTSTKNPAYRDVLYVEELIGPGTVDTIPPATWDAFRDHGRVRPSLEEDQEGARRMLEELEAAGISLEQVTGQVLRDGVRLFVEPFDKLLAAVGKALAAGAERASGAHGGPSGPCGGGGGR